MTRTNTLITTVAMLAGLSTAASAGTVTSHFNNVSPAQVIEVSNNGGTSYFSTWAGKMLWDRTGGTDIGGPTGDFFTFCVEITQHVSWGQTIDFTVVDASQVPDPGGMGVGVGMGLSKADALRELWGRHIGEVIDNKSGAAFQLAVWEIVYDDALLLSDGSFTARYATGQAETLAQQWLTSITGTGPKANLGGLTNSKYQDQVFFAGNPPTTQSVPLPAAAWGGIVLLGGVVARRLRRK